MGSDVLSTSFESSLETLGNLSINEYAMTSNIMLKDRVDRYMKNTNARKKDVMALGRRLASTIGLDGDAYLSFPMYSGLNQYATFQIMLEVLFASIMFLLIFLSLMLIYSLMLTVAPASHHSVGRRRTHV